MYQGTMVLPKDAVKMAEDELRYIEGGAWKVNSSKIKSAAKTLGGRISGINVAATVTCNFITKLERRGYVKRIRKGSQGVYPVVYAPDENSRQFAKTLCNIISLNGYITWN